MANKKFSSLTPDEKIERLYNEIKLLKKFYKVRVAKMEVLKDDNFEQKFLNSGKK